MGQTILFVSRCSVRWEGMKTAEVTPTPQDLVDALYAFIEQSVRVNGGSTRALKPGHRVKFHWPPPAVSRDYDVHQADWKEAGSFEAYGETFPVVIARSKHGVFGRCEAIWLEAMGKDDAAMLRKLRDAAEPLFKRQLAIGSTLGRLGRYSGSIRDLSAADILKLLYCEDRDVANTARIEIETHATSHLFTQALITILRDRRHPNRRIAQWCVLDLFEDLATYATTPEEEEEAVEAMRGLLWDAEDDFARAVFKAGTVIGGHLKGDIAGPLLIESLNAPSRIGRRAAIHGLFHVVEWQPSTRDQVVTALRNHVDTESDPLLKDFAESIAHDIERNSFDHRPEPTFPDEP